MPRLTRSLQDVGTPAFERALQAELVALGPDALGLQQGLTTGSISLSDDLGVMLLRVRETPSTIEVRVGIFYTSVLSGCSCADDPTPTDTHAEYCEMDLEIDRQDGETRLRPV